MNDMKKIEQKVDNMRKIYLNCCQEIYGAFKGEEISDKGIARLVNSLFINVSRKLKFVTQNNPDIYKDKVSIMKMIYDKMKEEEIFTNDEETLVSGIITLFIEFDR